MPPKPKPDIDQKVELQIRRSIQKIDESIRELEHTKRALATMLPKNKIDVSEYVVTLSSGKKIDAYGREIKDGS